MFVFDELVSTSARARGGDVRSACTLCDSSKSAYSRLEKFLETLRILEVLNLISSQIHCVVDARHVPANVEQGTNNFNEMCGPLMMMYPLMPQGNLDRDGLLFAGDGHPAENKFTKMPAQRYVPETMDHQQVPCGDWMFPG